ncbi:MAG: YqaJ viral recombinase family protein [Pseudomonadota bacterium]
MPTILTVEQGSDDWHALRRGRITASHMGDVMAKPHTKRYRRYRAFLIQELLGYEPNEESAEWFEHGKQMEPRAIGAIQWRHNVEGTHDVFAIHSTHEWLGASPDLYVAGGPVYEIKSRAMLKTYLEVVQKIEDHREGNYAGWIPPEYRWQLQCQMFVLDIGEIIFANYHEWPEHRIRKLHTICVRRDPDAINVMEERAMQFMTEVYDIACVERAA